MPRLLNYLAPLYVWLYALDPMLPQALFVSMVFFSVWLLRKLAPNQWEAFANLIYVKSDDLAWWQLELRHLWQALPAAMIGTLYGILGTGAEPIPTLKTALLGLLAPVVHRIASRYKGQVGPLGQNRGGPSSKAVGPAVLCFALPLLMLVGCAGWKPYARTADGLAETLCAQFFGEKQGLSLEDAAKQFCATEDDLRPWIDQVLAAKRNGGKAALARSGAK